MAFFTRRELATLYSPEELLRVRELLARNHISSSSKVWGMARSMGRWGSPRQGDVTYTVYVHKNDYDRAAHLLRSPRDSG